MLYLCKKKNPFDVLPEFTQLFLDSTLTSSRLDSLFHILHACLSFCNFDIPCSSSNNNDNKKKLNSIGNFGNFYLISKCQSCMNLKMIYLPSSL